LIEMVPVFFEGNEDDVVLEQLKELTLAWIEIT
jgi:hypothetical protein